MIKNSIRKLGFDQMLKMYLQHRQYFYWKCNYCEFNPFNHELRLLTSAVNAFTDNEFDIANDTHREAIQDLVEFGFGMEDNLCTEEQLARLKDLFPESTEQFDHFIKNKTTIGDIYCLLFDILLYGYEYVSTFFKVNYPLEANIIYKFKETDIYIIVVDNNNVLIEAMKILLGSDFCNKTFTYQELQEKYNHSKLSRTNEI